MSSPQRTCIGCRRKGNQSDFLRVSRDSGGRVVLCEGTALGRSVYFCRKAECIDAGLAKKNLERGLKGTVPDDERERIRKELECKLR